MEFAKHLNPHIKPDPEDFEAVASKSGEPTSERDRAEHCRLAQANKLIRLYSPTQSSPQGAILSRGAVRRMKRS
jgi:hypothetical protein